MSSLATNQQILEIPEEGLLIWSEKGMSDRIYPPRDREPLSKCIANGLCAFTDAENRYYLCKEDVLVPIFTVERNMTVLLSDSSDRPMNSFLAQIIGR